MGILFPASVISNTKQISVTCRALNNTKIASINGKIYNIPGIINFNEINNWDCIKGKSLWANVDSEEADQINNSKLICFSSLNDLLDFSINLIDDSNKTIEFNSGEKKVSFSNFKIEVFLK